MIQIARTNLNFEREPLIAPFGFKGGFVSEIWQTIALMQSTNGNRGVGLGVQSVLWSDARVFTSVSESGGNAMMLLLCSFALQEAQRESFATPMSLLDHLLPRVCEYGRTITQNPSLRTTFALNALVAVDNAAWMLYAAEKGLGSFDMLIPEEAKPALAHHNTEVVSIPAVGYGLSIADIVHLVEDGYYVLKIKMGADPEGDGDPVKMLEWDKERMTAIHHAVKDKRIGGAPDGRVLYYLDANGRYDSKQRILDLLDHLEGIGAMPQTILLEEPFPEEVKDDVRDIPVRVVADESAHTDTEALERIQLGYGAIAIKPIAKTLSMSFKIAQLAYEHGTPAFCADLTVNPILVDWNKSFASRLAPIPGLNGGALENNGFQNYCNWERMRTYHPCYEAPWMESKKGVFHLTDDFYQRSGGMLLHSTHYDALVK